MPRRKKKGTPAELANTLLNVLRDNDKERAIELIEKGDDVNFTFDDGKTLLLSAIFHKSHIVSVLIDAGADVKATDDSGKTALMYCAKYALSKKMKKKCTMQITSYQELVSKILQKKVNVNISDKEGKTALIYAALYNRDYLVTGLLEAGADVSKADNEGRTALMYAAQQDSKTILTSLIKAGAEVNKSDKEGRTALQHAFLSYKRTVTTIKQSMKYEPDSEIHVVTTLLEAGADVNKTDNRGRTVLMYAAQQLTSKTMFTSLIKAGADVNIADVQGMTSLMFAVKSNKPSLVNELVKAGADVNKSDNEGKTVLIYAAEFNNRYYWHNYNGNENVLQILIDAGADVSMADNKGKTALDYSLRYDHVACTLIDAGANVKVIDRGAQTALLMYSSRIGNQSVIQEIINAGIDINVKDNQGNTALVHALECKFNSIACALLDAGADYNIICIDGKSVLSYAAIRGMESVVQRLIKAGADMNITDNQGMTALMYAIELKEESIACALLDAGADTNIADNKGDTALIHFANRKGTSNRTMIGFTQKGYYDGPEKDIRDKKIISKLIDANADLNATNDEGKTALMYAIKHNKESIACALLDAGADADIADNKGDTALIHFANRKGSSSRTMIGFTQKGYYDGLAKGGIRDKKIISKLIDANADLNATNDEGKTALMYAIEHKEESIACALLDAGADTNIADNKGDTALIHFANRKGSSNRTMIGFTQKGYYDGLAKGGIRDKKIISKLIDANADLNATNDEGETALMYAIEHKEESIACALLDAGADTNIADNKGDTALIHFANRKGRSSRTIVGFTQKGYYGGLVKGGITDKKIISNLIDANADLNATNDEGKTALMYAIKHNKESIAHALLDAGADQSVIDNDGQSALLIAVIVGSLSVVQRLIKAGADMSITNNQGRTALMCAVLYGKNKLPVVVELIKAGVDVNTTDNKGKTALIYCTQDSEKLSTYRRYHYDDGKDSDGVNIAIKLIETGADVNITDDKGKTALMYAVENDNDNLAYALIDTGVNINITDKQGKSALSYCVQTKKIGHGKSDIFDISESIACKLIKAGADVNITADEGETLLMYAVQYNKKNLTSALIEARADINISDKNGKTALIYSLQSQHNNQESLALIKAGADVNIIDHEGHTALFYALAHKDVICTLIEDGNATVNKRDEYGRSVLFYCFTESLDSTRYLLEKGGKLNLKDNCNMNIISFWIENVISRKKGFSVHFQKLNTLLEVQPNTIFEAIINSVFCKIFHLAQMQKRKGRRQEHIFDAIAAMQSSKKYIAEQAATESEKIEKVIKFMKGDRHLCTNLLEIADLLVELGANPHYADSDGNTALHYATCLPLVGPHEMTLVMTMCHKLEDLGVSFNAKNHKNETPLLFCLSRKEWINTSQTSSQLKTMVEVCNFLLEHGSSVEETTRSGKTVFHFILELFQEGLSLKDEKIGKEVLAETVKLLELFPCSIPSTKVAVNKRDANLNSPLHLWAMLQLHLTSKSDSSVADHNTLKKDLLGTMFKHLVACGVKLNGRNNNEETPIHLCRSWTAVKLLIDAGANPKVLDSEGYSPLLVASRKLSYTFNDSLFEDLSQEPKAFWKMILECNLDPWAVDNHGTSVLSILIQNGAVDLSKALVEIACEENYIQTDTTAVSLLNAICQDRSMRNQWKSILVETILKSRKAKPISYKSTEDTALYVCCRNIVKPSQDSEDSDEEEIFHYNEYEDTSAVNSAKTSVHWTIAKQLLTYGMDCNALGSSGQSCLDIAKKCPSLKSLLLKPLDLEFPLVFQWTSISTKYKPILSKVARRQECKLLDSYWYYETNIQKGSFGLVFAGMNEKDGREVAIKRIEKLRSQQLEEDKKEIKNLTALADCEQVVRYLSYTEDEHFCYVILELMEGNLDDYLDGTAFDDKKNVKLCGDVLNGLNYLHQQNIFHRDLKPSNILFKTYPKLCLKIADFGLSRRIDSPSNYTYLGGSVVGTRCWIAPEVLKFSSKETKQKTKLNNGACDVFSAGLVLYYILSRKKHPFSPADCKNKGELQISNETEANVINDRMESFDDTLFSEANDLMHSMLDSDPTKRPTAAMTLTHPFFWPEKKKMDFISAVGNQPEFECPRALLHKRTLPLSIVEKELDGKVKNIMAHPTWDDAKYVHMPTIYKEMTQKRRPYTTSSVVELVRFIRNTLAHVSADKRLTLVKQLVLEDFVFLEYFPNLVMEVFKCIKKHRWDSRKEIKYQLG